MKNKLTIAVFTAFLLAPMLPWVAFAQATNANNGQVKKTAHVATYAPAKTVRTTSNATQKTAKKATHPSNSNDDIEQ